MIKSLLLILTLAFNIYALPTDDLQKSFIKTTDKVVVIVQNKDLNSCERNILIIKTITPMFDFKLMAKLSLGKYWKTMESDQQNEFIKLYVNRMKQSYSSKIDKYTDEKITVNSITQAKKTRITLNSSLISADDKLEVVYKFYKPKKHLENKDLWLVYDVVISGVSIIKTDKAQFKAVLQESSIAQLMEKLRK